MLPAKASWAYSSASANVSRLRVAHMATLSPPSPFGSPPLPPMRHAVRDLLDVAREAVAVRRLEGDVRDVVQAGGLTPEQGEALIALREDREAGLQAHLDARIRAVVDHYSVRPLH